MKRFSFYTLSAAAVVLVTAATPFSALAANYGYGNSCGNGIVIGSGNQNQWNPSGNNQSSRPQAEIIRWGSTNSGITYGGSVLPDANKPDNSLPDADRPIPDQPDNSLPDADRPIPDQPDNSLPDADRPIPEQPDNSLPDADRPVPDQPQNPDDMTPEKPGGSIQDEYADEVVNIVNQERAKAGLAPLSVDAKAAEAAQVRAQEIKGTFSHTRPNGGSYSSALTEAGASFRGSGENIAYGQNSPEAVMQTWMNSSGHRANILNANYTSIGVGHYKGADGTDYWTQLFIY